MKKVIFISLISLLLFSFKDTGTIKWYSLTEGVEIARRENIPMLLFVYVSWCDKCQRMDKKVFTSKEVMPLITENFIAVRINPEVDSAYFRSDKILKRSVFLNEVTPGKLAISVPTTVFYREKEDEKVIMNGILDPSELKENIQKFLKNQ
ncbi:MAG: thioredoxin family protein [Bacteroidota bacterium]